MSRSHALFEHHGDSLTVADLNSRNGTFVAGEPLGPHVPTLLNDGTLILYAGLHPNPDRRPTAQTMLQQVKEAFEVTERIKIEPDAKYFFDAPRG